MHVKEPHFPFGCFKSRSTYPPRFDPVTFRTQLACLIYQNDAFNSSRQKCPWAVQRHQQ